jgi:hypothetical protein
LRLALTTYLVGVEGSSAGEFARKRDELARVLMMETLRIILAWCVKVEAFIGSGQSFSIPLDCSFSPPNST